MPPPPTARLLFRTWTAGDFDLAFSLWGDAEVTRYIGGPFSAQSVRGRVAKELENEAQYGVQYWPIFLREGGDHAGVCGLRPRNGIYALGFHLHERYWGRGLAREAAQAVIAYAFEVIGTEALFAGHHPRNSSSRTLLERLGFEYTGDEWYEPTGLMHPSYLLRKASS
ncbi:MAG TPA: GNAT family N-acetyltransferase [Thermoanaerobaculia bacterium]|nr:GNAT family N-acetyltransferase [Thermoanaerobaculia bacterium]